MLEGIVRPFQSPNTLARRRLVASASKIDVGEAVISWGAAGDLPSATQQEEDTGGSGFQVIDCNDQYKETSRTTSQKRVENPNDPDQYVIVELTNRVSFAKNEKGRTSADKVATSYTTNWTIGADFRSVITADNKKCQATYSLNNNQS